MSVAEERATRNGAATRRLRVLQVGKFYPPDMGGMETHLQALCSGLKEHLDVRALVSSNGPEHLAEWVDRVRVTRLGTPLTFAGAPICPAMASRIRSSNADIVHLHLPNPAAVLAYLASGTGARLVVSYHSDVVRQRALDAAFRPFLFSTLDRASAILAATPNYIDSSPILSRYRSRCRVVPYGIPLDGFAHPNGEAAELRDRYGSRLVVSVGRLVYYKGFDTLIDAMRDVRGRLLIVGDGPLRPQLEKQALRLGIADRVTFVGGVEDVTPYCQVADVFALASIARSEAFGIVQLEAMACGKPVVNTNLDSGVPYVSRNGESGITVPPRQPRAMAAALNSLLDDPQMRDRYGLAARERVEQEFSQERMVEATLRVYAEVAAQANGRPAIAAAVGVRPRQLRLA